MLGASMHLRHLWLPGLIQGDIAMLTACLHLSGSGYIKAKPLSQAMQTALPPPKPATCLHRRAPCTYAGMHRRCPAKW